MKPAELTAWLAVLPPNTAAVEIASDGIKLQFFPPMPGLAPPEARQATERPAEEGPAPSANPDATILALMAQNGRA